MCFELGIRRAMTAGCEIQRRLVSASAAITEHQCPKARDRNGVARGVVQSSEQRAVVGIERVNHAITEITDEEIVREILERLWALSSFPRENRADPAR